MSKAGAAIGIVMVEVQETRKKKVGGGGESVGGSLYWSPGYIQIVMGRGKIKLK